MLVRNALIVETKRIRNVSPIRDYDYELVLDDKLFTDLYLLGLPVKERGEAKTIKIIPTHNGRVDYEYARNNSHAFLVNGDIDIDFEIKEFHLPNSNNTIKSLFFEVPTFSEVKRTHYLIYHHKGEIKIMSGRISYSSYITTTFNTNINKKYYTKVPSKKMTLLNGKIWCDDIDKVPECIEIIKNYMKELNYRKLEMLDDIVIPDGYKLVLVPIEDEDTEE